MNFLVKGKMIPPEHVEKLLQYLPDPSSLVVRLSSDFDYSSLDNEASELMPGVKFRDSDWFDRVIEDSTKKQLMQSYESLYQFFTSNEEISVIYHENPREISEEERAEIIKQDSRIDFVEARWETTTISAQLSPNRFNLTYDLHKPEPGLVQDVRNAVSELGIKATIRGKID